MSLRAGTLYTVNIYDAAYTGSTPIILNGGASPFTTEEDDNEDNFTPIRTQSGYLRIVDTGYAADGTTPFNWKDLVPTTDTDRPVTLTDGNNNVVWQGFIQAQNFGYTLYGNPQERELPLQCSLTVTNGTDINYTQKELQNFAYLLKQIVDSIPEVCRPTTFVIQGGTDAQAWLLKRIDWQNFTTNDENGLTTARYDMYRCLQDMCTYWGWTARTFKQTMYMTCADDADEQTFLTLTYAQLTTMAGGTAAGTTSTFSTEALSGDIFASVNNTDYRQRGPHKVIVKADGNQADDEMIGCNSSTLVEKLEAEGWGTEQHVGDKFFTYTNDLLTFTDADTIGAARHNYASFNVLAVRDSLRDPNTLELPVIRVKKSYSSATADAYASIECDYEHCFDGGYLKLTGDVYRQGVKLVAYQEGTTRVGHEIGDKHMYVRIGVGKTRATAQWFNGQTWGSSVVAAKVTIGNADELMRITTPTGNYMNNSAQLSGAGKLFIDFLGSDDLSNIDGEKIFDIANVAIEFSFTPGRIITGTASLVKDGRVATREYVSNNTNNVSDQYNADCIYASNNKMLYGYGLLVNPDDTFMTSLSYNGSDVLKYPEQHLADRIADYWATAKRMIKTELRTNAIADINPQNKVTLDSTTFHPIAISHDWRDDITTLTLLEVQ